MSMNTVIINAISLMIVTLACLWCLRTCKDTKVNDRGVYLILFLLLLLITISVAVGTWVSLVVLFK